MGNVGGIGNYSYGQDTTFYNCKNTGNIMAKALYAGGIFGIGGQTETIDNCVNTGTVTNSNATGKAGFLVGQSWNLILKNMAFETATELKDALPGYAGTLKLEGVTVQNAGEIELGEITPKLTTEESLASKIALTVTNPISGSWITLDTPGMTVTIPEDSTVYALNCDGANMSITNNGTVSGSINLKGANSSLSNTGTIGGVSLSGNTCRFDNGQTNLKTACVKGNISVNGDNCTVTNYGTVGENTTTHTLSYGGASGAVFNNYGTVYGCSGAGAYVIYTKDKVGFTLNLYSGSRLINRNAWVCTQGTVDPSDKGVMNLNWAEGTIIGRDGNALDETGVNSTFNSNDYINVSRSKIEN